MSHKQQRTLRVWTAILNLVSEITTYHIRVAIRRPTPTQSMNTTQSSSFIVSKKPMSSTNPNPTVDTESRERLLKSAVEKKASDLKLMGVFFEYPVMKSPVSFLFFPWDFQSNSSLFFHQKLDIMQFIHNTNAHLYSGLIVMLHPNYFFKNSHNATIEHSLFYKSSLLTQTTCVILFHLGVFLLWTAIHYLIEGNWDNTYSICSSVIYMSHFFYTLILQYTESHPGLYGKNSVLSIIFR